MKVRLFVFILIAVSMTTVFGKDYANEQYGIHFILPDHWNIVDFEDLPLEKQQRLDNRYHPFKTLSICGFRDHHGPDRTNVIIKYKKFEKESLNKAINLAQSEYAKKMMITSAKLNASDGIGREIKEYKAVETECGFVNSTNRAYGFVRYKSNNKPNLVAIAVKIFVKDGVVDLDCFSIGSEADGFVDTVNTIADSFQYDGNTSTINNTSETPGPNELVTKQTFKGVWKWAGIILTVSIVLGILRMLFFRD